MLRTEPHRTTATKAPCAMVPLKPNELRRHTGDYRLRPSANTSVGISNHVDTIEDRCVFSLQLKNSGEIYLEASDSLSCAFIAIKHVRSGTHTSEANPATAADGSK